MKPVKRNAPIVWALVTDSGCGRVVELAKSPAGAVEIETRKAPAQHLTHHELVSDASGRQFHAHRAAGHSMQPRTDAHEEAEAGFIKEWVDRLDEALSQGRFQQLVLVADPRTLGRLRARMGKALLGTVAIETARDLTHLPLPELEPRLRALLGWGD